jgi:aminoglycoside phosphotransferase (APT) family kinase protein
VNGAPFYVMAFVEGVVLETSTTVVKHVPRPEDRRGLGRHVIEVLARLHAVDVDAIGLGDLGRREGYVPRQLKRWRTQWEQSKTRELPAMEEVYEALKEGIPEQHGSVVVHGDYRLGNMLTGADARIAAVLDWELCTLGDPLATRLPDEQLATGESGPESRALAPTVAGGPEPARDADHYPTTGRDVSQVDYYRAFSYWRLAAIVEGVLARYLKGVMGKAADTGAFRAQVDGLAAAALERVRALGS